MTVNLKPLLRLTQSYFIHRPTLLFSVIIIGLIAITDVLNPLLVMHAIDMLTEGRFSAETAVAAPDQAASVMKIWNDLLLVAGTMIGLVLLQYFGRYGLARLLNRAVYQGTARLRVDLYSRLQAQSINFYSERRIGEVLTHLVSDMQTLQDATLDLISGLPFDIFTLIGLLLAMLFVNTTLALIVIGFLTLVMGISLVIGRQGWGNQEVLLEQTGQLTAEFQELLSASRTLHVLDADAGEQGRIELAAKAHASQLEQAGQVRAAVVPFFGLSEYVGLLLVLLGGGWMMLHGQLSAGGLVAFLAYMEIAAEPISRSAEVLPKLQKAAAAASRICDLLGQTKETTEGTHTSEPVFQGAVSMQDVEYRYPCATHPAIHKLNIQVKPGECVAVVGPNGAGKSTFLDLLLRLQIPDQGQIKIDGHDLKEIGVSHWRASIGVVPQDVFLLNRSIAENIALGSSALADVQAAAQKAGAEKMILALPKGFDTVVGERGASLSGGERQRVAIARLFLRDPKIILLDEPTAALDAAAERDLLPALQRLSEGRTTFLVSHRLALLERVDKVLILVKGEQMAFDTPANVWQQFPDLRGLFPECWKPTEAL